MVGVEKAAEVHKWMGALSAEFVQGVSLDTPGICAVGKKPSHPARHDSRGSVTRSNPVRDSLRSQGNQVQLLALSDVPPGASEVIDGFRGAD